MLIRKATDLTRADVTPKSVYLDRRKFLRAMGIAGATAMAGRSLFELATPAQTILAGTKFSGLAKSPFSTTEKQNVVRRCHALQQLLRIRHGQERPCEKSPRISDLALDCFRRRRSGQAAQVHDGRNPEARAARRAHLPASLRGGLVDRGALDRLFVQHICRSWSSPRRRRKFVAFQSYYDPKQMPRGADGGHRFALRRRPAHGRGHEPADAALRRACTARRCRIRTARRCAW